MARIPYARKLADDWPVIFGVCVALWFLLSAIGATGISLSSDSESSSSESSTDSVAVAATTAASESTEPVAIGPFKFEIAAFSVHANKKDPTMATAELTLEVSNTTKQNVDFSPSLMALQRLDDGSRAIAPKETVVMGVSPNIAVTAPVTFTVTPDPSAVYQLLYAGKTLYTGSAFSA